MAKQKKSQPRAEFTVSLHLRLKPEEYDAIMAEANKYGYSASEAARYIMFKKKGTRSKAKTLSAEESEYQRQLAVRTIVSVLKKVAKEFREYTTVYERSLLLLDEDGNPQVNTKTTIAGQAKLEGMMLDLQKEANEALTILGGDEIHVLAKSPSTTRQMQVTFGVGRPLEFQLDNNNINLYNMQKIVITGNIILEPKDTPVKSGEPMVLFSVVCEDSYGGDKNSTRYTVLMKKTNVVPYLKHGRQVTVFGKLRARLDKNSKGEPYLNLFVVCDDLVLGKE